MKSEDLMVGDWVYCEGQPNPDNVIIQSIHEDGVWFQGEEFEGSASYDRIFPIPLTPEILEKNGFVETDEVVRKMVWYSEGGRTEITIWMDDTMQMDIRKNIYYEDEVCYTLPFACTVHELQHALRLCGINKTIEL